MFHPVIPPPMAPNAHVQFLQIPPLIPKVPTPHGELDSWFNASREQSFGSRSFFDFSAWE
jgi:hypothetical protein